MQVSVYNFCLFWASLFSLYLFVCLFVFTKFMYFYNYRGEFIYIFFSSSQTFFFFWGGGGCE